jgi:hypothetical protein
LLYSIILMHHFCSIPIDVLLIYVFITYLWYVLAPPNERENGECDGNYPYEQYYEVCLFIITS